MVLSHVPADAQDAARRPGGRRDPQPQAAGPGRVRAPRPRPGSGRWLPLGKRVLDNVAADRARGDGRDRRPGGAAAGAAAPRAATSATGRWPTSTATCCSGSRTARAPTTCSGPTHEEIFTLLVKDQFTSYKDLPVILYQVQTKYRDEARPRVRGAARPRVPDEGLVLLRHLDEGLAEAYAGCTARRTSRIFARLGLDYRIVSAVSGAMGGSASRGVPGARRRRRGHLRGLPRLRATPPTPRRSPSPPPSPRGRRPPDRSRSWTPPAPPPSRRSSRTCGVPDLGRLLKNLLVDGRRRRSPPWACPATARSTSASSPSTSRPPPSTLLTAEDFAARPDLVRGYVGPQGTGEASRYLADPPGRPRHAPGSPAPTRPGSTPRTSSCGRDFTVDRHARPGRRRGRATPAPRCGTGLTAGPRHRDRPHLPARPQVRRRLRARRPRPGRQAGPGDHGQLRHRRLPRGRRPRRADRRRRRACAGPPRSPPPTCTSSPPARAPPRTSPPWPPTAWTPRASGSCSTTAPSSRRA